jgi:hypothetical protein
VTSDTESSCCACMGEEVYEWAEADELDRYEADWTDDGWFEQVRDATLYNNGKWN